MFIAIDVALCFCVALVSFPMKCGGGGGASSPPAVSARCRPIIVEYVIGREKFATRDRLSFHFSCLLRPVGALRNHVVISRGRPYGFEEREREIRSLGDLSGLGAMLSSVSVRLG